MSFQLFSIFFELCDPFVSMLIAIGFELIDLMREEWLYYLIGLHFIQKNWF